MRANRKESKMTIKEALTKALDNPSEFPLGWETELKDVFRKSGREMYERRQRHVWVLAIQSAYSDEPPNAVVCRSHAKAVEMMDKDINETLSSESPHFDPNDLVRPDDDNANLGDEIVWRIVKTELLD